MTFNGFQIIRKNKSHKICSSSVFKIKYSVTFQKIMSVLDSGNPIESYKNIGGFPRRVI